VTEQSPRFECFISPEVGGARLYVVGWMPPSLRQRLDAQGEAVLASMPDLGELDRFMWSCDAPYDKEPSTVGGVSLASKGRGAIVLAEWMNAALAGSGSGSAEHVATSYRAVPQ
jgi:hypothetical protein